SPSPGAPAGPAASGGAGPTSSGGGGPARPLPSGEAPLTTGAHATAAGPAPGTNTGSGTGSAADALPTHQELDAAFGKLESGAGPKGDPTNMYAVDANALTDARFSRSGGAELDVRNISKVGTQDAPRGAVPAGTNPP